MKKCFYAADILLPDPKKTDLFAWATLACDQFTSEPEYWESADRTVGNSPSALRIMLPEVYLGKAEQRIPEINQTMTKYLSDVLIAHKESMIYLEREQSDGRVRKGLILAIDLECYDYTRGADSLIRATEATVAERIPPRVAIRRGAVLEMPHVMLLIDDPQKTVIEPLEKSCNGALAYDTPLMLGGGHAKARFLSEQNVADVSKALMSLASPEQMAKRYGDASLAPLLFAVGDGNHSLATAKATYEEIKATIGKQAAEDHPARYALVEVVNIHDDALSFEPIYRVMFGVDTADVIRKLTDHANALDGNAPSQELEFITESSTGKIKIEHPVRQLTVGTLQEFIDGYIASHPTAEVDYIHGVDSVLSLVKRPDAIGFTFDGMSKSELFKTVIFDGALPRKTFSMGHARDKRYYMECRKITP